MGLKQIQTLLLLIGLAGVINSATAGRDTDDIENVKSIHPFEYQPAILKLIEDIQHIQAKGSYYFPLQVSIHSMREAITVRVESTNDKLFVRHCAQDATLKDLLDYVNTTLNQEYVKATTGTKSLQPYYISGYPPETRLAELPEYRNLELVPDPRFQKITLKTPDDKIKIQIWIDKQKPIVKVGELLDQIQRAPAFIQNAQAILADRDPVLCFRGDILSINDEIDLNALDSVYVLRGRPRHENR